MDGIYCIKEFIKNSPGYKEYWIAYFAMFTRGHLVNDDYGCPRFRTAHWDLRDVSSCTFSKELASQQDPAGFSFLKGVAIAEWNALWSPEGTKYGEECIRIGISPRKQLPLAVPLLKVAKYLEKFPEFQIPADFPGVEFIPIGPVSMTGLIKR